MNLKISKNAGYCFGVKRAMKMAWDEVCKTGGTVYSLGPLIHNRQAVEEYEKKGLKIVNEISDVPNNSLIIIRSHGVGRKVYLDALDKGLNIVDTTCPFVKKIHDIASEYHNMCYEIIIIGDKNHPEVIGIDGWCDNSSIIIKEASQVENLNLDSKKKYCVVAQTTIDTNVYNEVTKTLKNRLQNIVLNDTICSATKIRQQDARKLAQEVDCMIVVGGKHSSNTQKLVNVCEKFVPVYAIEQKEDLDANSIKKYSNIGMTAGASTPEWIIQDVIDYVKNLK